MTEHRHLTDGTLEEKAIVAEILRALGARTPEGYRLTKPHQSNAEAVPLSETLPYLVLQAVRIV